MKFLLSAVILFSFTSFADAQWVVNDPPTFKKYDHATAITTYRKGIYTWRTYNVPEIARRNVVNTFDWLHYGLTYPFSKTRTRPLYLVPRRYSR